MDLWQYLMLAAVAASLWLGWWNATSWVLALSYFSVETWWRLNGKVPLEPGDLFMVDLVTVVLIYCKAVARDTECIEYEGFWHQLRCFLAAPTACDRIILAAFPLACWPAYVANIDPWWWLYGVFMIQVAVAAFEALSQRRKARAPRIEPDIPSSGLQFAWAGAERWST